MPAIFAEILTRPDDSTVLRMTRDLVPYSPLSSPPDLERACGILAEAFVRAVGVEPEQAGQGGHRGGSDERRLAGGRGAS